MDIISTAKQFLTMGCKDQVKCSLAARVYLDLKRIRKKWNVNAIYDADLDLIQINAECKVKRKSRNAKTKCEKESPVVADDAEQQKEQCNEVRSKEKPAKSKFKIKKCTFLPVMSSQSIDLKLLERMQQKHGMGKSKSITLAIVDSSSTILYYSSKPDIEINKKPKANKRVKIPRPTRADRKRTHEQAFETSGTSTAESTPSSTPKPAPAPITTTPIEKPSISAMLSYKPLPQRAKRVRGMKAEAPKPSETSDVWKD